MDSLLNLPSAQEAQNKSAQILAEKQNQARKEKLAETLIMKEELEKFEQQIISQIEKNIQNQERRIEIYLPKNLRIAFTGFYNLDEKKKKELGGHVNNYDRSFINENYPEISLRLNKIQNILQNKGYKIDWKNDSESEEIYLQIFLW